MEIVPYNPQWPTFFMTERNAILEVLNQSVSAIHHVGSTAIIGACAKPIIDIAIESATFPPTSEIATALSSLGYKHEGTAGVDGRHWFWKGHPRSHHIHWCPLNGEVVTRQIAFRDKISSDPVLLSEYSQLKQGMADLYDIDSPEYAAKKNPFIERVLNAP